MNAAASVEGGERQRLFCALRLPAETVDALVEWQRSAFGDVRDVRILSAAQLHVTLAFLGHRPSEEVVRQHASSLGQHTVDGIYEIAGDVTPDDFPLT